MLGPGQQVDGHQGGVGRVIGHDNRLGGAEEAIDAHLTEQAPLGSGHEDVAGAAYLVHPGHRFRAVGHGGDSLHTAGAVDTFDAGDVGRHQLGGGDAAIGAGWRAHDQLAHPRHPRRHGDHQHGRGVDDGGARRVDARPLQGPYHLPAAIGPERALGVLQLAAVVVLHPLPDQAQGVHQSRLHLRIGGFQFLRGYGQGRALGHPVQKGIVTGHGPVAVAADVDQHPLHHLLDRQLLPEDRGDALANGRWQILFGRWALAQPGAGRFQSADYSHRYCLTASRPCSTEASRKACTRSQVR
ncbi:hypothetical protein HRbin24_02073 [bacterium HR24]|nr:hypothetical protein HRbin24_02073 [bacterium HR24]